MPMNACFLLDLSWRWGEAANLMRRFAIALTPCLFLVSLACSSDAEEPNAFMSQGYSTDPTTTASGETTGDTDSTSDTDVPPDMPASTTGDGDGDPASGDGDGDPTTTTTTTTGDPECGNGVIDDGEQCDGGNLGGFTCVDLGYTGGTLACDPVTCTYDASGCVTDMEMGGGTTG